MNTPPPRHSECNEGSPKIVLYDYFRSSAGYRVRIALNLKNIPYTTQPISLTEGVQHQASYTGLNPQHLVPSLDENGTILTQSLAIIDYLEERYPTPPLLPKDPYARAAVRSLALFIACDMHPINNLRVREQLKAQFQASDAAITSWCQHWIKAGFDALETQLKASQGLYCYGNTVSLADLCLIPQVYSAQRFEVDLKAYPRIASINAHCLTLPAFAPPVSGVAPP